jgi:hypothetical protein
LPNNVDSLPVGLAQRLLPSVPSASAVPLVVVPSWNRALLALRVPQCLNQRVAALPDRQVRTLHRHRPGAGKRFVQRLHCPSSGRRQT